MQQQEPDLNKGQQEDLLRQKRFALVLTGDDRLADILVGRAAQARGRATDKILTPTAIQFFRYKTLYELWMGEAKKLPKRGDIFQPGRENEAIQKGLDPSIAKVMGGLPSLHRAILLLIYGEDFSYAATAQLLSITTEELMTALASARQSFSQTENSGYQTNIPLYSASNQEMSHDATQ
jgi:hypothetical protein